MHEYGQEEEYPSAQTLRDLAFETVRQFALSAGGDGDGWVISNDSDYRRLADLFEQYENEKHGWFKRGEERVEGIITFGHNQEGVHFVKDRSFLPSYTGEIVIQFYESFLLE